MSKSFKPSLQNIHFEVHRIYVLTAVSTRLHIQGVNKGLVAEHLLVTMKQKAMLPDFVLCIGDDRSDEDMFEVIMRATAGPYLSPVADVFACTVGQKCSKAKYYVEDRTEILRMLQVLASASEHAAKIAPRPSNRAIIDRV